MFISFMPGSVFCIDNIYSFLAFPSTSTADSKDNSNLQSNVTNVIQVLQKDTTTRDSECEPGNLQLNRSCLIKDIDNIKYVTIANVTSPLCRSADCGDESHFCMCNKECVIYKDCCSAYLFEMLATVTDRDVATVDVIYGLEYIRERLIERYPKTVYQKHTFLSSFGKCILLDKENVLMIGLCPTYFSNEEDKHKCEMAENVVSIRNIPVVQMDYLYEIHVHFKNVYCALCHNISIVDVMFWNTTADCGWGLPEGFTYSDMLKKCDFVIAPPDGSASGIRPCVPNYFPLQECEPQRAQASSFRDKAIVSICQSYISPVAYEGVNHRNMHCAACFTGKREFQSSDICLSSYPDISNATGFKIPGEILKVLFDFNPNEGVRVMLPCNDIQCKEKQMYDCVSRKCRIRYCSNNQHTTDDCVPRVVVTAPIALPETEPSLMYPEMFLVFDMIGTFNIITDLDIDYYKSEIEKNRYRLEFIKTFNITASEFVFESNTLNASLRITASMSSVFTLPQLLAMLDTIGTREEIFFKPVFKSILLKNYVNESKLHCRVGNLKTTSEFILNHDYNTTVVYLHEYTSKTDISQVRFKLSLFPTNNKTESISFCEINQTDYLTCQMVLLDKEEYRLENGSLYLLNTTKVYRNGTFILGDRGAFVCVDTLVWLEKFFKMFDYSPIQWILSVVAKALSMVALLTIIAFHVIYPKLRNLHGLNLVALSTTLLLAHGLLFVYHIPTGTACQVTGVLLHFLWLSVFTWMNIIGFDVTRTFYSGWSNITFGATGYFRRYFTVAFGMPLILVTLCVIFHVLHGPVEIDYGKNDQCWLGNQEAVIIFFLVPIIISVFINIALLGITIAAIERAKKVTHKVRSRKDRVYCLVYFKLTVILGLSWFVGITAVFVDIPELWYFHIVFNGLQGLSVFVCFAMNARFLKTIGKVSSQMKSSDVCLTSVRNSARNRY
ncbi:hypothetical protein ACJMK2_005727 [Sinanodonta woodiana]|uniref:G-protein coupled receptors family 2 profile 2 domain-containing protein n=1 Tax=Sinanodonta woodiana TaxID=1069815 RepID=A0ABD3VRN5_SINWO